MRLVRLIAYILAALISSVPIYGQDKDIQNPPVGNADNDKKDDAKSTTLKAIISQLDKLSRAATKDYVNRKATADKQDSVKTHRLKLVEFLESLEGKKLELAVVVKDIANERPFGPFADTRLMVSTTQPKELAPFIASNKPLRCSEFMSFQIDNQERPLFDPRKPIFIRGEIVFSKRLQIDIDSAFAPIHLFQFFLQPAVLTQNNSDSLRQTDWAGISIANVEFSNKPFTDDAKPKN